MSDIGVLKAVYVLFLDLKIKSLICLVSIKLMKVQGLLSYQPCIFLETGIMMCGLEVKNNQPSDIQLKVI